MKKFIKVNTIFWFFIFNLSFLFAFFYAKKLFFINIPFVFFAIVAVLLSGGTAIFIDFANSDRGQHIPRLLITLIKKIPYYPMGIIFFCIILGFIIVYCKARFTIRYKKPAIYLYPEEDSIVHIQLKINGKIIKDIPPYKDGWRVFVTRDGIINNQYDYLFYEVQVNNIIIPQKGWVVEYKDLEDWFEDYLPVLGLNKKEGGQFKEYWLNNLPYSAYYAIRLIDSAYLNDNLKLIINPEPDTLIRVFFYFEPHKEKIILKVPQEKAPERKGFTVVEWGGILKE